MCSVNLSKITSLSVRSVLPSALNAEAIHIINVVMSVFSVSLAHLSRRLIGELIVYKGIHRPSVVRPSVRQHFQTTSPLKPRSRFFSYFTYSIYRSGERIIVFFIPVG